MVLPADGPEQTLEDGLHADLGPRALPAAPTSLACGYHFTAFGFVDARRTP